jgi:hypothetical protein
MRRIVVAPREGRQIEVEIGEGMACLENAGIRDYSARIERLGAFWVADPLFRIAVKVLSKAGFKIRSAIEADEGRRCSPIDVRS